MTTLVLPPQFSSDSEDLRRAAASTPGWDVHRAIRNRPPDLESVACVFGPIPFCDSMAERMGLGLLEPPEDWLGTLPRELLKRDLWIGTVADMGRVSGRCFVKPANDKVFPYGVYERASDVPVRYVAQHCPIVVSEVVAFDIEVRLHVLDHKVVTASQYRLYREGVDEDQAVEQAIQFVTPHLTKFCLPSAVVVDVGHIEDRGWAVIEANQVYASGLYYQADPRKVLPLLLRSAGPRGLVQAADESYLRRPL